MRYVSPIRRERLREGARTVCTVAAAAFMVSMVVVAVAFAVLMVNLAEKV